MTHLDLSAGVPLTAGVFSITPVLHFQISGDDFTKFTSPTDESDVKLWGGVSIGWSNAVEEERGGGGRSREGLGRGENLGEFFVRSVHGTGARVIRDLLDIPEELAPRLRPDVIGGAEHGRGVHGRDHRTGPLRLDHLTPVLGDPEAVAQQRLRGRAPQRDHYLGLHQPELLPQPRLAGAHLGGVGLLVQPPLDQLLAHELEVLDGVGDVDHAAIEAGGLQRLVEKPAGGPDERPADAILLIPRLLADEDMPRRPPDPRRIPSGSRSPTDRSRGSRRPPVGASSGSDEGG